MNWPVDQIHTPEQPPKSALGTQSKQAPCAEPAMIFKLEESLHLAAATRNPLWLGILASYLQTFGCLRLAHVKRSCPVRVYKTWVEFFCVKGKQRHNRQGFYWGASTRTTTGWDWATPFLELCNGSKRYWVGFAG